MINLLSPSAKRKLAVEYRLRLGIVVLWFVFALEILAGIAFAVPYLILSANVDTLAKGIEQRRSLMPTEDAGAEAALKNIKSEITLLKQGSGITEVPPSVLLQNVLDGKPRGILVNAFSYGLVGKGGVEMQLSGIAGTRDGLLEFQANLKKNPQVSNIKYGSSFITKKTDIAFTVTITFK